MKNPYSRSDMFRLFINGVQMGSYSDRSRLWDAANVYGVDNNPDYVFDYKCSHRNDDVYQNLQDDVYFWTKEYRPDLFV